jgi:transcriptional regulator with GAF, ATPase, and Fis domain
VERYTSLGVLGQGGAGRVSLVEDRLRPGSRIALKELHSRTPEQVESLRREFATLAALRHPSLIEVFEFDVDSDTGAPRFTMEWIDGEDIVAAVRREGPGSLPSLAAEALRALAFLHDFGLVHRDLKPENLLVRRTPKLGRRVVLLDFGLAAERHAADPALALAGTLSYLAPELFDGAPATKKSDLYALGAVLFEAVHGRPPFALKGDDFTSFVDAVRAGRRSRPALPSGHAPGLGSWIDSLLSPDPALRPTSAVDALARLNDASGEAFALETMEDRAARLGSGPPVGRDTEIARLRAEIAPAGKPRVVFLAGDAGSGKTRLLRFLGRDAIAAGWTVHTPPPGSGGAIGDLLERVRADAATNSTLVLLDEVERAEAPLAAFLDRIAREPREAPVHVVAAVRPSEIASAVIRKLVSDTGVVPSLARVDLEPMGDGALRAMIDRATAARSVSQTRIGWLRDASEGNAGAAETLLVEGIWEGHRRIPVASVLEQSIRRRLESLSPEGRAWLDVLAVLGERVPTALVAELSGLEDRAPAACDEAIALGLARRFDADLAPDSRRVAEIVRRGMPAERLTRLHVMAATHYAAQERDLFGASAWRLARLWQGAGETDRALAAALDAASAAEVNKDDAAASERYGFALRLLPRRDKRRGELWTKRAEAARRAMLQRDAAKGWGWAARHAKDPIARMDARARQSLALYYCGRRNEAERMAKEILAQARAAGAKGVEARCLNTLAILYMQRFEYEEARRLCLEAAGLISTAPSELRADVLNAIMVADGRLDGEIAMQAFEEALSVCHQIALPYRELMLWLGRAQIHERRREFADQEAALDEARRLAALHHGPAQQVWVSQQFARLHLNRGRVDQALKENLAAEELALFGGDVANAANISGLAGDILTNYGRAAEAAQRARSWIQSGLARDFPRELIGQKFVLVWALLFVPDTSESEIRSLIDELGSPGVARTAITQVAARLYELVFERRHPSSVGLASRVEALAAALSQSHHVMPVEPQMLAELEMARSLIQQRDWNGALARVERVIGSCSEEILPRYAGEAHFLHADVLDETGRVEEARESRVKGKELLEVAANRIEDRDLRRDFLEQPSIRSLLAKAPQASAAKRLEALYEMIQLLNSETDPEALLASILEMAMRAVDAERGMILLTGPSGADFSVRLSRNLEAETAADAEAFSRRIVEQASEGEPILALDAGQDERFREFKSVSLYRIRSLMCVPLRSRSRIVGTVYLDSRRQGRLFTQDDLKFVEAFANHAALALENAKRRAELELENKRLRAAIGERASYGNIVGRSPAMQRVFDLLEKLATTDATVLVQGESGTGKELVARAIHANGPRKDKIFLSENCAAIPETLLESELFGHVRGAFTGADRDRVGLFEQAHDGTLFLDEVGDMSAGMQARLLRVVQDGELRRVGDERPIKVDVRLITATNKDLSEEVRAGHFREDLYYRLAVVPVALPPLRERIGDVGLIAGHLMERIAKARGRATPRIDADVLDALERYPWPGNVRQMENVLRRFVLHAGEGAITSRVVEADPELAQMLLGKQQAFVPVMSIAKSEEDQIRRALEASGGNRDRAARLLGISRATIYRKMREYSLR